MSTLEKKVALTFDLHLVPRSLQKKVSDRGLLRYMTGEWFYETKQLRHRERIHGTDIVRASMKQAQKPLTLRESGGKKKLRTLSA